MKKLFALVLAFCLILCVFTGCKPKNNENENGSGNGENTNDTPSYTVVAPIADGGNFDGGDKRQRRGNNRRGGINDLIVVGFKFSRALKKHERIVLYHKQRI